MKVINQVAHEVLALVWFAMALMYAVKENDKEMAFLALIISLQYQSMLIKSIEKRTT